MKKLSIILGLALVMLTAGCSKDATNDVVINDRVTVLNMNIENDADSRTSLGEDGYDVLWSAGDCVAVNGVSATIADEYAGKSAAVFAVSGVVKAPYNVLYPASALNADGTITVSEVQPYAANSFAQGAAVMVGYSATTTVQVKNLYGLVKLTIKKEGTELIKSITIHSNNLEAMTGVFSVDYAKATITPMSGMDFVKVVAPEGIAYDAEGKVVIYVAVPAGEYTKGFTVKVATDTGTMSKTVSKSSKITVERNKIYTLPALKYSSKEAGAIEEITNATQLQAFLNACKPGGDYSAWKNADGEVVLGSDIDLSDVTITPADSLYNCVFNGRGYKLKNWESDGTALFTKTAPDSFVKNIVIDASCSMEVSKTNAGYKAFVVAENFGTVSGCSNYANMKFAPTADLKAQYMIGSIVGKSGNQTTALVTNCYNEGNLTVTIPSMTGASYYFGGIVANTSGKSGSPSLSNCINKGDVTVEIDGANGWKNTYIGGVSGACNHNGIIKECVNEGKVDFYLDKAYKGAYVNIGGITGYTPCAINYCKNYGDVSIRTNTYKAEDAPQITRPAIGGIAGYANSDVTSCKNYGYILLQGTKDVKFEATTSFSTAGVGYMGQPAIGGVCGSVGYPAGSYTASGTTKNFDAKARIISDCHNYGTVEVINHISKSWLPVGGVVGFPTGTIEKCTNEKSGLVKVTMGGQQTYLGGVYGCTYQGGNTINNCANYGKVWFVASNVVALKKTTTRSYTGGISGGYNAGSGNTATGCVNEGEVLAEAKMTMNTGGLFAAHNGTITNCINRGPVTMLSATYIEADKIYASEIGGIVGYTNCPDADTVLMDGCESYGKITNNSDAKTDTGGLIGAIGDSRTIQNCIVDCEIVSAKDTNAGLVMGSTRAANEAASVAVTLGAVGDPITIKKSTTLNGTAVTAADIKEGGKLAGILRGVDASIVVSNVVLE